jgi:hypothetical protein
MKPLALAMGSIIGDCVFQERKSPTYGQRMVHDVQSCSSEFLDGTSVTRGELQQLVSPVSRRCSKCLGPHNDHGEDYPSSSCYCSPNFASANLHHQHGP